MEKELQITMPDFWVYILYCANDQYYTGYTVNLIKRYCAHQEGIGAKFTRSFRPLFLASAWPIYGTKQQAAQLEWFIKKMDRKRKQELVDCPLKLEEIFFSI